MEVDEEILTEIDPNSHQHDSRIGTFSYKMESEFTVKQYKQLKNRFIRAIDFSLAKNPKLVIGSKVKFHPSMVEELKENGFDISEMVVQDFYLNNERGFLVKTWQGNFVAEDLVIVD